MASSRKRRQAALTRNVVPGVHWLEHAHVNCYLIEDGDGVTLVINRAQAEDMHGLLTEWLARTPK